MLAHKWQGQVADHVDDHLQHACCTTADTMPVLAHVHYNAPDSPMQAHSVM
jgi:hypothetical protein